MNRKMPPHSSIVNIRGVISLYFALAGLLFFLIATICNLLIGWSVFGNLLKYQQSTINIGLSLTGIIYLLGGVVTFYGIRLFGNLILPQVVSALKWITTLLNLIFWIIIFSHGITSYNAFEFNVYWLLALINYLVIVGSELVSTEQFRLFSIPTVSIYLTSLTTFTSTLVAPPALFQYEFFLIWLAVILLSGLALSNWGISTQAFLVRTDGKIINDLTQFVFPFLNENTSQKEDFNEEKEIQVSLNKVLSLIGEKLFKISIAHPYVLTKRYPAVVLVQFYFEELNSEIKEKIKSIIGDDANEHTFDTEIKLGSTVKIKLYSPDITFPEPIIKNLDSFVNSTKFLAKPMDSCQPGEHLVVLTISDNNTGIEYQSEVFTVKVVDFAFDHVSRPLLSKISAVILGIGSFAMFVLTFLEQIDKTIGLTSGTAAGVFAAVVYANLYNLYQRVRLNTL